MKQSVEVVDARISPEGRLDVLSRFEVSKLLDTSQGDLYKIFQKLFSGCAELWQ